MELDVIYNTDALQGLMLLPDESVDCIVTSPPYWQMRDYGIPPIHWQGDANCDHSFGSDGYCNDCGGWLGQLGHEPTRDEFILHLCLIFDECKRVLKPTGTLWVNLGDTYNNARNNAEAESPQSISRGQNRHFKAQNRFTADRNNLPQKSLCNIPNKFADEMILRGWALRNEIIWYKRSCMPFSGKDRFTNDFEKIFFFVKSKRYFFNQQFEPYAPSTPARYKYDCTNNGKGQTYREISGKPTGKLELNPQGRNMRCVWAVNYEPSRDSHFAMYPSKLVETPIKAGCPEGGVVLDPFMGAGTTAVVAHLLGRKYIGFEPNPEFIRIAEKRLRNTVRESRLFE